MFALAGPRMTRRAIAIARGERKRETAREGERRRIGGGGVSATIGRDDRGWSTMKRETVAPTVKLDPPRP